MTRLEGPALMMSQEEYMQDIKPLRKQGWTLEEIGEHVGYHPATRSHERNTVSGPDSSKEYLGPSRSHHPRHNQPRLTEAPRRSG